MELEAERTTTMWGLLTPLLFAILIVWLMARWVRLPEYAWNVRDWWDARRARPTAEPAVPAPVSAEELELRERYKARRDEVLALSSSEALERVNAALGDARYWRCVASDASDYDCAAFLSPSLRAFLGRWQSIEDAFGGLRIRRDELTLYTWPDLAGLSFSSEPDAVPGRSVCLGVDRDGDPLVVREARDLLTVVHGGKTGSRDVWFSEYPSLYHYLLLQHQDAEASMASLDMDSARRLIDGAE